jgi:hypothetical protein
MCLNKIIGRAKGTKKTYIGYKVFDDTVGGGYTFPFYGGYIELNKELTANRFLIYGNGLKYTSGFHIFRSARAAHDYRRCGTVFKVRYSGRVLKGLHIVLGGKLRRCDVAEYMIVGAV